QEYEVSFSPPSPFSVNLSEECDNEIYNNKEFEQEEFSLEYLNEILNNNDTNFENFKKNKRNNHEKIEKEEIIDYLETTELTPCVVIDFVKVDRDAIKEVDGVLS
ncbi:2754_t:CDS:2, partial [Funneliformis caledonium]